MSRSRKVEESYYHAEGKEQFSYYTLPDLLDKRADDSPDVEAHIFRTGNVQEDGELGRIPVTFKELADNSLYLSAGLLDLGLKPGDRIVVLGHNCPEWLFLEYACLRLRIHMIRVEPQHASPKQLMTTIVECKCRAVFLDLTSEEKKIKKVADLLANKKKSGNMRLLVLRGDSKMTSIEDLIDESADKEPVKRIQSGIKPDDIAVVLSTSGSGGHVMFAQHTHFNIINNYYFAYGSIVKSPADKYFNDRPFSWTGSNMYLSVVFGMTLVHLDPASGHEHQSSESILRIFSEERITIARVMDGFLQDIHSMSKVEHVTISQTVHTAVIGGEALPEEIMAFTKSRFKKILMIYGSTENLTVGTSLVGGPEINLTPDYYSLIPYTEVKVTDHDAALLLRGQPGNLWIRSPFNFRGYIRETESTVDARWVQTTDAVVMDNAGKFRIIGRTYDLIKIGKDKESYPIAYEHIMRQIPEVNEAVAFGVPLRSTKQDVCVCVTLHDGFTTDEHTLHQWMEKFYEEGSVVVVAKYIVIMHKFPRLPNGKTDRHETQKLVRDHLGIEERGREGDSDHSE